ncbi:MAG TPA: RAMP superfamily CRISPR-associated protein [Allocoleopsis sp.]
MKAITFLLHTEQPLLATSFQGDPNSDVSYPYIPGSMIRGALIGRYLKQNQIQDSDIVADENIRRLFFNGKTRYLNAYLLTQEQKQPRSLPIPRSWFKQKNAELPKRGSHESLEIYDLSQVEVTDEDISLKSLGENCCTVNDNSVVLYEVERRINIHNERHRRRGRATEAKGEIFRYEALDKGQKFQAVIVCEDADVQIIGDLLRQNENLWLGGSQSAGYGHTQISEIQDQDCETWNEVGELVENRLQRNSLHITLLSDLILRDESGQYIVEPPIQLLAEALGLEEQELRKSLRKSYMSGTLIGGFNRKWGLPLPQVQALAAGSIFVFDPVPLTLEQIRNLEIQGIGERKVDGFGRVAVNWLNLDDCTEFNARSPELELSSTEPPKLPVGSESIELARDMAKRLLRQRLDAILLKKVGDIDLQGRISNSQLSRLMLVARKALNDCNLALVRELLDNLPSNARGQFESTRVNGKSLDRQIRDWLEKPSDWLDNLQPVNIAGETYNLSDDENLAKEYTLLLIMAVAKKASREKINDSRPA